MGRKIVDRNEYDNKVSKENKWLAKDFLQEKKAQGKSEKTLYQYSKDFEIINTMIYRHFDNKCLLDMSRKDIRNLSLLFQDMRMSNARINRLMSCLRSALDYFEDSDDIEYENNIGRKVKGLPKAPVRETTFLSDDLIYKIKDVLIQENKLLIAVWHMLAYISAARKNELHQVEKDGLTERYYTNKVIGKRGKKFRLYYNQEVQDLIKKYLDFRGKDNIPYLFVHVNKNGDKSRVAYNTYNYWCEIISRIASNIEGKIIKVYPHSYRHSRLENLSTGENRDGIKVDINRLKVLANHESVETTQGYLDNHDEEALAEIFNMDKENFVD